MAKTRSAGCSRRCTPRTISAMPSRSSTTRPSSG
jgi:hypothetical protein